MIRQADQGDWDYISSISAKAGYDDYINSSYGPSYLDEKNVYVIIDDKIEGFIKLDKLGDGALWFSGLRISPDSRRKHMGTRLMDFAYEFAKLNGCNSLRGLVETANYSSIKLMDSFGMKAITKFYFFSGGIDISDYTYKSTELSGFVDKQWKFEHNHEKVYRKGSANVFFYKGKLDNYTVLSGNSFKYIDTGMTCASEGIARYITLKPFPEFESGYIFEKLFIA
jgi:GNAT superfamily N-acetyltransferase